MIGEAYDAVGNRLSLTDPVGNTTSWTYDALNRVVAETNELGDTRTFEYDAAGRLTRRTDRNERVTEYAYNRLHLLAEERWLDELTVVRTFMNGFDKTGRLLSVTELNDNDDPLVVYTHSYDLYDRLETVWQRLGDLLAPREQPRAITTTPSVCAERAA